MSILGGKPPAERTRDRLSLLRNHPLFQDLPASVIEFPTGAAFGAVLARAGFTNVRFETMTFGVVYLYLAERP